MKRFLIVAGTAGVLLALLTATGLAAFSTQATGPQGNDAPAPGATVIAPQAPQGQTPGTNSGAGTTQYGWRMGPMGRGGMGGGMFGRGMLTGSAGTGVMAAGMTLSPMHYDVETLLGVSRVDLYIQMATGKTLVQIAAEKGITEAQLVDGIMAGRHASMDQAVAAGWMTQAQADAMLATMAGDVKAMVNGQGVGFGSASWGMMWNSHPLQPDQVGQQGQLDNTSPGWHFGPFRMHR